MSAKGQLTPITLRLTSHQAERCAKLATYLWPEERLDVSEISRRLLLEHLTPQH
jgi:hypothetical protein